ncbi:MAG TPA: VanZ family protein [Candidatus Cryosericum sp.]|nr:VanZ family protein [Candidatus Cryosericum sp.]
MLQHPPRESARVSWTYFVLGFVAILMTVPVARTIQNWVADHWGRQAFTIFVIACVVITLAACARHLARLQAPSSLARGLWLLVIAGIYGAWTLHLGQESPEEAVHFLEYGGLSLLAFRALSHRHRDQGIHIAAALLCALAGTFDEILQWLTPGRYWDFADVALNVSSGALMQAALWRGMPPAYLGRGVGAESMRLIRRLGTAQLLLIGLCASNTPPRTAWLSRQASPLQYLATMDDVMMEYGYQNSGSETGAFFSRFPKDDLIGIDAQRGEEAARVLDEFKDEARYPEFLGRYTPATDPFLHEARVHLFRRDRFLSKALWPTADDKFRRDHATVAYHENQILEGYFPRTLHASSYVLPSDQAAFLADHVDRETRYVSRVSDTLVCRIREWQIWLVILILLAGLQATALASRRQAAAPVRSADPGAGAG